MSVDWVAIEKPEVAGSVELDGPRMVFGGRGVRITASTATDPALREANLHARMYGVAALLHASGVEGISALPGEDRLQLHGGTPTLYVTGNSELDVLTTIGQAALSVDDGTRSKIALLGFNVLREWT